MTAEEEIKDEIICDCGNKISKAQRKWEETANDDCICFCNDYSNYLAIKRLQSEVRKLRKKLKERE